MHDTTETTTDVTFGETPANALTVTAEVTLRDRSNVAVTRPTIESALSLVRRRHHTKPPIIELAPVHAADEICFHPQRWRVTATSLEPLDPTNSEPTAYQVEYHSFTITTPGHGPIAAKSSLPTVVAAAQSLANREVEVFALESDLPGFRTLILEPAGFDDIGEHDTLPTLPPKPTTKPKTPSRLSRRIKRLKARFDDAVASTKRHAEPPRQRPRRDPRTPARSTFTLPRRRGTLLIVTAAIIIVLAAAVGLTQLLPSRSTEAASAPAWMSPPPVAEPSDTAFLAGFDTQLWELPADRTAALSWYTAGVAYITPDSGELVLVDTATGNEIAKTALDGPVEYTAEFMAGDTPAIAARTEKSVSVITRDGTTQTWGLTPEQSLSVTGSTPIITDANGSVSALLIGQEAPVEITVNPQFIPIAADDQLLLQVESGKPRLVTVPFGSNDAEARTVTLKAPTDSATFVRHISAGYGWAIAQWNDAGTNFVVVHDVETGAIAGAAETTAQPGKWQVGRGLNTAILGNTAFNLADGTVTAQATSGDFITALGPTAVAESNNERTYYLNDHIYNDPNRVIGFTNDGIALIRQSNGVVTANEKGTTK